MRKTRFMSMLFLVWSIAFFFVPEFPQGLQVPILALPRSAAEGGWLVKAGTIPAKRIAEAAGRAEQQRDARTLAFAALHAPTVQEGLRWADQAIAIDPSLTWVSLSLIPPALDAKQTPLDVQGMVARLEKWDPDNAVPYVFEASEIAWRTWPKNQFFDSTPEGRDKLAKETEWCQAMQKAFTAPRYDTYMVRKFDLERNWLRQNHLDKPPIVLMSTAHYTLPNLLYIRSYADLLVDKYGKEAEEAKHLPEALGFYWTAEHFGARMRLNSTLLIERLVAVALQLVADKRLIPALRSAGQKDAAAALEMEKEQLKQWGAAEFGNDPLTQSANYSWAVLTVEIFAGLVAIFGTLAVICLLYINAKRWVRPEIKGRLYRAVTVAGNYVPVLLFVACAGLYLSYYPYAQNLHHYMTATGEIHYLEPLFFNIFPNYGGPPGHTALPVGNPFRPYAWYAVVGLILAVLAAIPYRRQQTQSRLTGKKQEPEGRGPKAA
jgi:hypothetical protein